MKTITRSTCRLCGSDKLEDIYSLGELYVSTFLKSPSDVTVKAPLTLMDCKECGLVQLRHTAPQELMYASHYWYRSGTNPVIKADLHKIAREAEELVGGLHLGDVVLDAGANDGTLLEAYPDHVEKIGCEPAKNLLDELGKRASHVIPDFWKASLFRWKKAKIVTAIGMFYDMEDPNQFIGDVAKVLHPDGLFVAQLMTLKQMLEKADVGNICAEHLEYYTYASLKRLYEQNGLEIFRVEETPINGGSYKLFARHLKDGSIDYPEEKPNWGDFIRRIEANRAKTVAFIKEQAAQGLKTYVYGASTKANTILQWYGLSPTLIHGAADISPEKIAKRMVGSLIRVCTEEEARENADFMLVGPYAFRDHFLKREEKWLRAGGQFIFSTPRFEVVNSRVC